MVENIDVVEFLVTNPPEFLKTSAIALSSGFVLVIATYISVSMCRKMRSRKVKKGECGVDDDL